MTSRRRNLLFFDCETTGLPRTRYFNPDAVDDWPRLVQLAWARYDALASLADTRSHVVRPEGFRIPADATKIHGITQAHARRVGRELADVLDEFLEAAGIPETTLVAHNLSYDINVVAGELVRTGKSMGILDLPGICTMKETTQLCQLPRLGGFGYKWPTLDELHHFCFGRSYEGAHDAARDLEACARSFFRLVEAGYLYFPAE